MRRIISLAAICAAMLFCLPGLALGYSSGHLMDNTVMDNVNSMSEAQIQEFLTARSPCLAAYTDTGFSWNGEKWAYSSTWTAAKIIFEAGQFWELNPQVIITKLQQEESLVTGTSCESWRYQSAMGYDCPDSGGCSPMYAGFTLQVLWGAFQIKFDEERSQGTTAWGENGEITYSGFMLKGTFARCEGCSPTTFSGIATIDGTEVYLETGATAALYSYTPHLGYLFEEIFEEYGFGPTVAGQVGLVEPLVEELKSEPPPVGPPPVEPPPTKESAVPSQTGQNPITTASSNPSITSTPTLTLSPSVPTPTSTPKFKPKPRCHTVVKRLHGKRHKVRVCVKPKHRKKR